jgi:hypothetical protein
MVDLSHRHGMSRRDNENKNNTMNNTMVLVEEREANLAESSRPSTICRHRKSTLLALMHVNTA